MSADLASPPESRSCRLMIVIEDPVFRLGLRVGLEPFSDVRVVAEAEDSSTALQLLDDYFTASQSPRSDAPPNVLLLDISLGHSQADRTPALLLCRHIKTQYPQLAILMLGAFTEPVMRAAAQRVGADGYCLKSAQLTDLAMAIRQVAAGQSYWIGVTGEQPGLGQPAQPAAREKRPVGLAALASLRRHLRQSGLNQINATLAEVTTALQRSDVSLLDRAALVGRQRELRAARWLVERLLAAPALPLEERLPEARASEPNSPDSSAESDPASLRPPPAPAALVPAATSIATARDLQSVLFDAVSTKLQTRLENATELPLEVDILREEKKRELFYLALRKLEDGLDELRYSQVQPEQVQQKQAAILQDLWRAVTIDFFGKYYSLHQGEATVDVVEVLLQEGETVQAEILDKIPGVTDVLNHLLFQAPLVVDSVPYPPGNPAAVTRAEVLLHNWVIQLANAVIQPLLNRFANVEEIKQNFYSRRLLSNREIERFRNDLSWRYRLERYIREPVNMFESQYRLFTFSYRGIEQIAIYAPRTQELEQLSGVPLVVTLALETRDAIAPRLRSAVSFLGNGLIYVLTEVIGRSIGLIGRGILKGLGNTWTDSRFNRK